MSGPYPPDHPTGFSVFDWRLWLVAELLATTGGGGRIWRFVSLEDSAAAADARCLTRQHFHLVVHVGRPELDELAHDLWWARAVFPRQADPVRRAPETP